MGRPTPGVESRSLGAQFQKGQVMSGQNGIALITVLIIALVIAVLLLIGNCFTRSSYDPVNATALVVIGPSTVHVGAPATFTLILTTDKAPLTFPKTFKVDIVESDPVNDDELIVGLEVKVPRGQNFAFKTFTLTCKELNADGTSVFEGAGGATTDKEKVHEIQAEGTGVFLFDSNDHSVTCVAVEEQEEGQ